MMGLLLPRIMVSAAAATTAGAGATDMHLRLNLLAAGAGTTGAEEGLPMLDIISAAPEPRLTWQLPAEVVTQTGVNIRVQRAHNGSLVYTRVVSGSGQNATLQLSGTLEEATVYLVSVTAAGIDRSGDTISRQSTPLKFFTALRRWEASPIWAAPCAADTRKSPPFYNNTTPQYAWFRGSLMLPAGGEEIVSALAFVSAEAPLSVESAMNTEKWGLTRGSKILGGYKLLVNGHTIGVGPGRPRCAAVSQGACQRQTPFDGFALSAPAAGATKLVVEIHAYGRDQPIINLTQRVIFQLVVRTRSGARYQMTMRCDVIYLEVLA
eukprot:COSAG01_NODE_564_length_15447_cov_14.174811_5_plen_322_part_00